MVLHRRASHRPKTRPIWPWLEENRALVGVASFLFGAALSALSIYIAIDANTRSRQTANRLTELSEGSLTQLKTQTGTLSRQTNYLSQQLDEQRTSSSTTATKLDNVIDALLKEVTHLTDQTSSLSELVKQGKQQNIFAVQPFGWWRRDNIHPRDTAIQATAHSTIQSALYAWPAKRNAIAFLTDAGIPLPGLQLGGLSITDDEFHNHDMIFSDFSQTALVDVLFAPTDSNTNISLKYSQFRHSRLSNVRFIHTELGGADFSDMVMRGGQFIRSFLHHSDFSRAELDHVTFDTVQASTVNFRQADLFSVLFLCRDGDAACVPDFDPHDVQEVEATMPFGEISEHWEAPFTSWEDILSTWGNLDLHDARIGNSTFSINPHIWSANFSRAQVFGTSLDRQKFYSSSFHKAGFMNSHFRGAVLHRINARDAVFIGVSFADAKITMADLSGAVLSDVDFSGSRLTNLIIDHDNLDAIGGAQLSGTLFVVGDDLQVYRALEQLSGVCAMDDFVGFMPIEAEQIADYYKWTKDPDKASPFKPVLQDDVVARAFSSIFMPRKCDDMASAPR